MKLLLIDTCGATGTIALADTNAILATATLPGRTASERLIPAIKSLLADSGLTPQSLTAIAVVHGPGSFTGVRIGLSAAKGLCEALAIPLIAISRLAVLASLTPPTHRVHALLDAGRTEFYYGEYVDGICLRESLLTREEVLSTVTRVPHDHRGAAEVIVGTLTTVHSDEDTAVIICEPTVAESLAILTPHLVPEPIAATALPLALHRIHEKQFDDIATIDANYVRRTDAEIFAKPKPSATAR